DAQAKLLAAQAPKVAPPAPPGPNDDGSQPPAAKAPGPNQTTAKKAPAERSPDEEQRAVSESYLRSYRARRRAALRQLPAVEQLVEA
ncbi:MAG TPA: hypothetical protein VFO60_01845, partial [Candidatus Dormibacteraeota bacterium]|nr:hypothetical protein [Candidatus Dormibacteraeota bacterium]